MHFNWCRQFSSKQTRVHSSKRQLPFISFPCRAAGSDCETVTLIVVRFQHKTFSKKWCRCFVYFSACYPSPERLWARGCTD